MRVVDTRYKVLKSAIRASFKWENISQLLDDSSNERFHEDAGVRPIRLTREIGVQGFSLQNHCNDGNL